ncbi:probable carboxylesterase Os04g0669500 isoform X2 [Zingiber officinale]|uniref:probable carboxylesterase Os04g0669500 isoform X2 n=1 Tax=Zingiber officinale TaxID=94328 RepID=UPI001C4CDEED|nr:probable carboxylesterase Os04g0669500 isoform X2 [Zingiber officinale]
MSPSGPSSPLPSSSSPSDSGVMPSWFDIYEILVTSNVHAMIDKEVDNGVNSENIFVFGFTQGGALRLASVLLYQRIMGGGAVYSGLLSSYKKDEDVEVQEEEPIVKDEDVEVQQEEELTEEDEVKFIKIEESEEEDAICLLQKTPILWSHGMADRTVLFEAGQAGPPFLVQAGMSCEFKSHDMADRTVLFEAGQAGPPFLEQASMSCEFKAYPNVGHSITTEELLHLQSWIKALV